MNLINGTHDFCERREYAFNVLPEYSIITRRSSSNGSHFLGLLAIFEFVLAFGKPLRMLLGLGLSCLGHP
jgi:hypothetical protein